MTTRRECLRLLAVAFLVATVPVLGSCVPQQVETSTAVQPVTLVLGAPSSTLIPYSSGLAARQLGSLVFQSLVGIDASGTPVPDLTVQVPSVENGGVSGDGLTVEYALDADARWHDGRAVTASDVVFTYGLLESGALVSWAPAVLRRIRSVEAVEEHRVRVVLWEPDWPGALRFMPYVLPKHLLEGTDDLASDPFWERPVGSGPYRITSAVRRRAVSLERVTERGLERITCVFHDTPAEQLETWDSVGRAIWPGASVDPVGSERLSTVPSDRYRYWLFNVRATRWTSSLAVRRLMASVLSTATPAGMGAWGASSTRPDTAFAVNALRSQGWRPGKEGILERVGRSGRREQLEVRFAYSIDDEADGFVLDSAIRTLRGRGFLDRRESTLVYGDYFDRGAILPSGDWDVARVVLPEGTPFGAVWPFDPTDVPSVSNPGGLNLSAIADAELQRLAIELRDPHEAEEAARLRARVGQRLDELCLIVPDIRLDSRVLSRGVDGVFATEADIDFTDSWGSWSIAKDATDTDTEAD